MKTCWIALLLAALLAPGCYHYRIHNNTPPSGQPRNTLAGDQGGLYDIHIEFETNQTNIERDTIQARVQVSGDSTIYDMYRTRGMKNRWETKILVPPDRNAVEYHIRMDWQYNAVPVPKRNSIRSRIYKLFVLSPENQ